MFHAPGDRPRIVVIAGPTATGKTSAAVAIARHLGGELIGADSVQIYREFDVGSAKPTPEERDTVRHHLIDALPPDAPIDAMGYAQRADAAIDEARGRRAVPIVVGGTGLWLRALVRGLVELPEPERHVRERLERDADERGLDVLHRRLQEVDPAGARAIHPNDRVRLVRSLEVYEQTGTPMSEHQARHALGAPRYGALFVVADLPKPAHDARIRERVRAMIDAGWPEEARRLLARWGPDVRPFGSVGYRQMLEHVRDGAPLDEVEARIVKATRMYARRQRTWFKNEPGIAWRTDPETLAGPEGMRRIEAHLAA